MATITIDTHHPELLECTDEDLLTVWEQIKVTLADRGLVDTAEDVVRIAQNAAVDIVVNAHEAGDFRLKWLFDHARDLTKEV